MRFVLLSLASMSWWGFKTVLKRSLFFCHEKLAELARQFSTEFIMDCTYKTNGFGMALLNIIGITATDSTFNAGLAFICNETEPMLCLWELQSFDIVTKPSGLL
ncbi:hypothetical protein BASA81_008162 [Batrachochytrium salamandrivorans]|nr:hypothetical protein BASA81_008162 [Batrachochytrium salamandrivorans]